MNLSLFVIVVLVVLVGGILWYLLPLIFGNSQYKQIRQAGRAKARQLAGCYIVVSQKQEPTNNLAPVYLTLVRKGFRIQPKNFLLLKFPYHHASIGTVLTLGTNDFISLHVCETAGNGIGRAHLPLDRPERFLEVKLGCGEKPKGTRQFHP